MSKWHPVNDTERGEKNAYQREYREKNGPRLLKQENERRKKNRQSIRYYSNNYYYGHRAEHKRSMAAYRQRLKVEVLTYYGHGTLSCVRCGYDKLPALSLDHIIAVGHYAERHKLGLSGSSLYKKLRHADYPSGYQTLCMNCQYLKRAENNEHRRKAPFGKLERQSEGT